MPSPIDALRFVHSAILYESDRIDEEAAGAARGDQLTALADDVAFFEELVLLHTKGEELGLFPALADVTPHIDETYLFDHEGERSTFAALRQAIDAEDLASARRAAAMLRQEAHSHVEKENTFILPLVAESFPPPEQGAMVGKILSTIPPERMPAVVPWIIERVSPEEAEAYVTVLEGAMPPEVFSNAKDWIREGVSVEVWSDLSTRLPQLTG